ncbi:DoxX family protein [bacterium]|nr:DoxX family protein [bacterium]
MDEKKLQQWQMIALVGLRVIIGWHFLYEGVAKLLLGNWSAAGFLLQSKWIFAPVFKWMANNAAVLDAVNVLNMWGLTAIGLGLILGCFTRLAALAGIAIIMLYYVCNPPFVGLFYSIPMEGHYMIVNKNLVEVAGLVVIMLFPTGRFAGLDRILHKLFGKK